MSSPTPHALNSTPHPAGAEKHLTAGQILFREGQSGSEMYIIRSGRLRVLKQEGKSTIQLAVVGPGGVLGELSLLDNQPRGATVQALEPVVATIIDRSLLQSTLHSLPVWLANILIMLVKRLRDTMKMTSQELARRNADSFMRVLLLLAYSEGYAENGELLLRLDRAQRVANATMGISAADAAAIIDVLTRRGLVSSRSDAQGRRAICMGNRRTLETRLNDLRAGYSVG